MKVIGSGYSKEDVNEALAVLRAGADKKVAPEIHDEEVVVKKGGMKWMKIGGILGFVFLGLMIISVVASLIMGPALNINSSPEDNSFLIIFIFIFMFTIFCLMFVYLYSFFRLGRYTDSKLIKISSVLNMAVMGISALLFIVLLAIGMGSSGFNGNVIADNPSPNIGSLMPLIIMTIIWIIMTILGFMLFVGLIRISDKVRFAKIAGIFGLCGLVMNVFMVLSLISIFFNPMFFFGLIMSPTMGPLISIMIIGYNILIFVLSVGMGVFNSLTLLDASKKYE